MEEEILDIMKKQKGLFDKARNISLRVKLPY
ncbi:hypothetical protein J2T15_002098 [Paenibacillus harenae]|uniref:Uncharacterized protein n=1 Tax=Paenibacillus harenae TaxID=306543 RepID=A0ABT9TZ60_PAEHA|nr:hypothetical protein [Paenibacillus harenae]